MHQTHWQHALSHAITDPIQLIKELDLDSSCLEAAQSAARKFRVNVPRGFLARMRKGDPADPLLRQVFPLGAELDDVPGYRSDPVGDLDSTQGHGFLQKYDGRALLIATGACAIHCRYCFRREFPYADNLATTAHWQPALKTLAHSTIRELILSGGDPLALADHKLRALTDGLADIPHIQRLRIHTRFPIVLPERIDDSFCHWLQSFPRQKVIVVHVNHPNEIDASVEHALARLRSCQVTLLNQSVLLKGINDDADTLTALSEKLFAAGVLPYYLHQLDPVRGTAHFKVDSIQASQLMQSIARRLPGYLVPRLVREEPGAAYKLPQHW